MIKPGCTVTKDHLKDFLASIQAMRKTQCYVGIPAEKTPRKGEPINNAALGYIFEFGSAAANIPARAVLVPGVKSVQKDTIADLRHGAINLFRDPSALERSFNRCGLRASTAVKKAIVALGDYGPDSKTLQARQRRGFKGAGIERVTGQFLNSFTYVIRGK